MKTLNIGYVSGLLETNGGWYLGRKKYLMFKLTTKHYELFGKIFKWLHEEYSIEYATHNNSFLIINRHSIHNLITFMEMYMNRQDYKKYLNNKIVVV